MGPFGTRIEIYHKSEGPFQMNAVKNLIQKCELIHQRELSINQQMSIVEELWTSLVDN